MKKEVYKEIPGYEGRYAISNFGNCKSLHTTRGEVVLKPIVRKRDGYIVYSIYKSDGKYVNAKAHLLVAKTFIQNPNNKNQVNHKDGDVSNNKLNNLEWATGSENVTHAYENGLMPNQKAVIKINGSIETKFKSIHEAGRKTNLDYRNIHRAINKNWTCGGFKWKYAAILLFIFNICFSQQPGSSGVSPRPQPKPIESFLTKYNSEAHFYGSFFINEAAYQIQGFAFPDWKPSRRMLFSSAFTLGCIALKERYDMSKKYPTGWSWDDFFIGCWAIPIYLIVRVCLNDFRKRNDIYIDPDDSQIRKRSKAPRKWSLKRQGFLN